MKRLFFAGSMPCIMMLMAGCAGEEIISDADPNADFTSYKTFSVCLADAPDSTGDAFYDNHTHRMMIRDAIESEMAQRYAVDDTSPDLLAGFQVSVEKKQIEYTSCRTGDDYRLWPECSPEIKKYTEGTLVIYVTDVKQKKVIWQASASGILENSPANTGKFINEIVSKIYLEFPLAPRQEYDASQRNR